MFSFIQQYSILQDLWKIFLFLLFSIKMPLHMIIIVVGVLSFFVEKATSEHTLDQNTDLKKIYIHEYMSRVDI